MPELPEVETIVRELREAGLVGLKVDRAEVFWERSIATPESRLFCQQIRGQKILAIQRRGKFLVFSLSQDTLLVHLRMTGKFILHAAHPLPHSHERVRLALSDGRILVYEDQRKFGKWYLVSNPDEILKKIGLEPLSQNFTLTAFKTVLYHARGGLVNLDLARQSKIEASFACGPNEEDHSKIGKADEKAMGELSPIAHVFSHSQIGKADEEDQFGKVAASPNSLNRPARGIKGNRKIKPFLMDQRFIAGLGNIYVDEALWEAGIHPLRSVQSLSEKEIRSLHQAIISVLEHGVENTGTSLGSARANYFSVSGRRGNNQHKLNVFRRDGLTCYKCQTTIQKIILAQRGTHFCPKCQPFKDQV